MKTTHQAPHRRKTWGSDDLAAAITSLTAKKGFPPTVRELCAALRSSPATVHGELLRLRRQGRVEWNDGQSRTLRVLK